MYTKTTIWLMHSDCKDNNFLQIDNNSISADLSVNKGFSLERLLPTYDISYCTLYQLKGWWWTWSAVYFIANASLAYRIQERYAI